MAPGYAPNYGDVQRPDDNPGLSIYNGAQRQFTPYGGGASQWFNYGAQIANPYAPQGGMPSPAAGSQPAAPVTQPTAHPVAIANSPLGMSVYNGSDMQFTPFGGGPVQHYSYGAPTHIPRYQIPRAPVVGSPLLNAIRGY